MNITEYLNNYLTTNNIGSEFNKSELLKLVNNYSSKEIKYNYELLEKWLNENNLTFKGNPIAWLKRALVGELEKGTFLKAERHCCLHPFLEFLKNSGVTVNDSDIGYIGVMFDYLFNEEIVSQKELIEFNHKAVNFLKGKGATTTDFINLWKRSKLCKERQVDWKKIDTLAQELHEQHFKLLEALENDECE